LNCAFFILGIDPLTRNINRDPVICVEINKSKVKCKAEDFADDVIEIYIGDRRSYQRVFEQYERLTFMSVLELYADKKW
jgi:hypothetical protein